MLYSYNQVKTKGPTHMNITPTDLRSWGACWTDEAIAKHYAGRSALSARDIADDDTISHADRMWVLTNALWRRDPWLCYDFALWAAEDALMAVPAEWQERARATLDGVKGLRGKSAEAAAGAARAARAARAAEAAGAAEAARAA